MGGTDWLWGAIINGGYEGRCANIHNKPRIATIISQLCSCDFNQNKAKERIPRRWKVGNTRNRESPPGASPPRQPLHWQTLSHVTVRELWSLWKAWTAHCYSRQSRAALSTIATTHPRSSPMAGSWAHIPGVAGMKHVGARVGKRDCPLSGICAPQLTVASFHRGAKRCVAIVAASPPIVGNLSPSSWSHFWCVWGRGDLKG